MVEKPKGRWFRFRLSTVLILTAIAAWVMATRPWFVTYVEEQSTLATDPRLDGSQGWKGVGDGVTWLWFRESRYPNPHLTLPALSLAAFLVWKAAWTVVERRRRGAQPE
ncbi:MAG: hypothetical protein K2Y37_19540 [Pirellulales bacterium]|nr:hypothetical protein [Pirellulales bacterium]